MAFMGEDLGAIAADGGGERVRTLGKGRGGNPNTEGAARARDYVTQASPHRGPQRNNDSTNGPLLAPLDIQPRHSPSALTLFN